jgi:hypothetical protein
MFSLLWLLAIPFKYGLNWEEIPTSKYTVKIMTWQYFYQGPAE